jgi:hypothetical protein
MGAITDRMAAIVVELEELDLRASDDPRNLLLPGVLVGPPRLTPGPMCGDAYDAEWSLTVVGSAVRGRDSVVELDRQLSLVMKWRGADFTAAVPDTFALTPGADPVPVYVLTWTETLPWP